MQENATLRTQHCNWEGCLLLLVAQIKGARKNNDETLAGANAISPDLIAMVTNRMNAALRGQLNSKGMEDGQRPDVLVSWRFGSANKRQVNSWLAGRSGRRRN